MGGLKEDDEHLSSDTTSVEDKAEKLARKKIAALTFKRSKENSTKKSSTLHAASKGVQQEKKEEEDLLGDELRERIREAMRKKMQKETSKNYKTLKFQTIPKTL